MGLVARPGTDDVQVAVRPEGQAERLVQSAAAVRDKSPQGGTGGAVIAQDAVIAGTGDVQVQLAVSPAAGAEHQAFGEKLSGGAGRNKVAEIGARLSVVASDVAACAVVITNIQVPVWAKDQRMGIVQVRAVRKYTKGRASV